MNEPEQDGQGEVEVVTNAAPGDAAEAPEAVGPEAADEELALAEVEPVPIDAPEPAEPPAGPDKLAARARGFSPERVKKVVESLLLVSEKPVTIEQMRAASGIGPEVIREAIESLARRFHEDASGIVLVEVAGGYQLRTSPDATAEVRRFLQVRPQRLTRAALETLAIVAYRQPVTRAEIEEVRGVDSGAVLKALVERRLVRILGRKEEPGRPILYGTTKEFLEFFSLRDLASLPTLREFQELSEEHRRIVEDETGEVAGVEGLVADLADHSRLGQFEQTAQEAESALEEMEAAMAVADARTRAATQVLGPQVSSPQSSPPDPTEVGGSRAPDDAAAVPDPATVPPASPQGSNAFGANRGPPKSEPSA